MIKEIFIDTFVDTLKLIPFLFVAFFIIEFLENRLNKKSENFLIKFKKYGVFLGSLLGVVPQCGFSVMATNLYISRIISLGTLVAIYLSTSDEMLSILLSYHVSLKLIFEILIIKVLFAIIYGFIIDFIIRKKKLNNNNHIDCQICKKENCHCGNRILLPALKHTFNISLFILVIVFFINLIFNYYGKNILSKILLQDTIFSPFVTSLIGLIPNCGTSVLLTELFLKKAISLPSLISGLLTNSGTALIILFRNNKNKKENLFIVSLLYFLGIISGIILELLFLFI